LEAAGSEYCSKNVAELRLGIVDFGLAGIDDEERDGMVDAGRDRAAAPPKGSSSTSPPPVSSWAVAEAEEMMVLIAAQPLLPALAKVDEISRSLVAERDESTMVLAAL